MGFTLRTALATLGKDAAVRVAELVPAVVNWARGPLAHIVGGILDDPRVTLEVADVGRLIGEAASRSEEHTSELQSLMRISYAVFCLKKKKNHTTQRYL